jgi:hypothetical protein
MPPELMAMMGGAPGPGPEQSMQVPGAGAPGGNPMAAMALSSMDKLTSKQPNPTAALTEVEKALDQAHQLVLKALPQIAGWNSKVAKDLHQIARQLMATKLDLKKEATPGTPPPGFMGGQAAGMPGMPTGGPQGGQAPGASMVGPGGY